MLNISVLLSVLLFVNVTAKSLLTIYEDEIDPVIDMLLNGEYDNVIENNDKKSNTLQYPEEVPTNSNGLWNCGNCTDMNEMKLLYSEAYDQDTNYDLHTEEINMEIQIGLSLTDMRCVTVKGDEGSEVSRVSGACAGDEVTLRVVKAAHCVVSVYG